MDGRPSIDRSLDGKTFRSFYYLKEELVGFCREYKLPSYGSKEKLTERIAYFLDTGEVPVSRRKKQKRSNIKTIDEETKIEPDLICSEKHRAFFEEKIGKNFSFNLPFQKWLRNNAGKTYGEAIAAYDRILEEKKRSKSDINSQFEYNRYIQDFFADNRGKSLDEAITCWKYKKELPGSHSYDASDLRALARDE